jgi:hypothetical protein
MKMIVDRLTGFLLRQSPPGVLTVLGGTLLALCPMPSFMAGLGIRFHP